MNDSINDGIETLGLSDAACIELRKCKIDTIQDLMLLINETLISKNNKDKNETDSNHGSEYSIGVKDAILRVMQDYPGRIFNCNEIRRGIIKKFGDRASINIGSIRSMALMMSYNGTIHRVDTGLYSYAEEITDNTNRKGQRSSYPYSVNLGDAVLKVVRGINRAFDWKVVRDKLKQQYGKRVSLNKSSIKTRLNQLFREGTIKRTETGDYIYCHSKQNKYPKDSSIKKQIFDKFLNSNIGKEIEFRYRGKRANSAHRWRREVLWAHDDTYFYISKQYSSGHHISFLKERIIEYRKAD